LLFPFPVVEPPVPVDGDGVGVVGATEAPLPDELVDPGEETEWDPLQELEGWNGLCGCGKSPQ
jgi:hypothetical protein